MRLHQHRGHERDTHEPQTEHDSAGGTPTWSRSSEPELKRYVVLLAAISSAFAVEGIATPGRREQLILSVYLVTIVSLIVANLGGRRQSPGELSVTRKGPEI